MSKIDDCAEDIIESNTCDRIDAGSKSAGSDIAGHLTARKCHAACLVCGEPGLCHSDSELMACYTAYNQESR